MNEYVAYHGTNSDHVKSICNKGFKPSTACNEWLGYGVYFFVGGAFCPISNAREWAKSNSWDNATKMNTYKNYSILETRVCGDRVLDLRETDDLRIFEQLRTHILERYHREKSNFKYKIDPDTFLCNSVTSSMKLDILIQNFYIKDKFQRRKRLGSRIPNSTVLCAKKSAKIDSANLKEIEKKGIEDE